jgi:hypothetical protein
MQLLVTDSTAQFPFGTVLEDLVVFWLDERTVVFFQFFLF